MNANLANDIGNLLNRTLNLLLKFCGGALPHDSAGNFPSLRCWPTLRALQAW